MKKISLVLFKDYLLSFFVAIRGYLLSLAIAILVYLFFMLTINIDEEYFVVPLEVKYPSDFVAFTPVIASVNVTVKGSPATLRRITREDMKAIVDFSDIHEAKIVSKEIELVRSGVFSQINNVEVVLSPNSVEISLAAKVSKQVAIVPSFINSSPRGYLFKNYRTTPSSVEISGPQSIVSDIESIDTENIDLSLYTQSFNRTVRLIVPEYISFVTNDADSIRVFLNIEPIIVVETYNNLPIKVRNLSENFGVRGEVPSGTLVVRGGQLEVESLVPEIYVDLSSAQRSGGYTLKVQSDLPRSVESISITPETVFINIFTIDVPQQERPTANTNRNQQPESAPVPVPDSSPESVPVPEEEAPADIPVDVFSIQQVPQETPALSE